MCGNSAGFLPKEKFAEHQRRSQLTRDTQEAIRVLDLAGLDLESDASQQLLREGGAREEVIASVRRVAAKTRLQAEQRAARSKPVNDRNAFEEGDIDIELDTDENTLSGVSKEGANGSTSPVADAVAVAASTALGEGDKKRREKGAAPGRYGIPADVVLRDNAAIGADLQPMSADDLHAYLNRYANQKKKPPTTLAAATNRAKKAAAMAAKAERAAAGAGGSMLVEEGEGSEMDNIQSVVRSSANSSSASGDNSSDLDADANAHCICQRCFRLQQYGTVEESLRPGWSSNELLTPERFETLLGAIKDTPSVVLCLVDIFDLKGSILANLKQIVGHNPVVIAANKVDLLPKDASIMRLTSWIHAEVKQICGYKSPRDELLPQDAANKDAGLIDFYGSSRASSKYEYVDPDADAAAAAMRESGGSSGSGGKKLNWLEKEEHILRRANVHLVSCQTGK